ncbi:hypothetical protein C900_04422 [Fulvivirga imtechensis AK7]|uniref:DUF4062 domain-containing protein n=1 Tax=Fulvivirga imtechensis AK7 TaxID=1237149 RepID=L8JMF4_9BACT|nr:DUF4062 domain-containing protein [Fulvivirga imtechensis]ELR69995.1 hypothetical protein C900_04422 [Fulvivirga imtechensis AK7]
MAFEIDILITYADADNQPAESGNGWVTDFKRFLELMLQQVLGEKPKMLLKSEHDSITGGDVKKIGILIPILSPSFIASGECLDTLEEFLKAAKSDFPRVFKVLKKPITFEEQPTKLRELIGFDLYNMDLDTGRIEDYKDFFSTEAEQNFWMKMVDLAYEIHESLISLEQKSKRADVKPLFSRRSIYLAETGHDLTIQRNIIKRELQRHGYKVLPDHTLPQNVNELKKVIKKEVEESSLSIHLIGNSYGEIPEGSDKSIVDIQNQIASEKSSLLKDKSAFSRLIWISPHLNHASEKQIAFIESIKRDMASTEGAEILQTPLEDFKNIVREELIEVGIDKKLNRHTEEAVQNGKVKVYMLYDKLDEKDVEPIKKFIAKSGFAVLEPSFEGGLLTLRQHHITNLRNFDAAIIYQGGVNDQWVRMKLLDLLKAPGFGRRKPVKGKAIISKKEEKLDISSYKSHNIMVIDGSKKDSLDSLKVFLEELK